MKLLCNHRGKQVSAHRRSVRHALKAGHFPDLFLSARLVTSPENVIVSPVSERFAASEWAGECSGNVPALVNASDSDHVRLCSTYVNGNSVILNKVWLFYREAAKTIALWLQYQKWLMESRSIWMGLFIFVQSTTISQSVWVSLTLRRRAGQHNGKLNKVHDMKIMSAQALSHLQFLRAFHRWLMYFLIIEAHMDNCALFIHYELLRDRLTANITTGGKKAS